jgi:hypothetical protein
MLTWEELRANLYEIDGSYRSIYVLGATREDWHQWMTYVNQHYPVRWSAEDHVDDQPFEAIDLAYIERRWDAGDHGIFTLGSVFLGPVKLNCHFWSDTEIEQDLDPSEFRSLEDHHRLLAYLVAISQTLRKEIIVTAEKYPKAIYLRVNGIDLQFS